MAGGCSHSIRPPLVFIQHCLRSPIIGERAHPSQDDFILANFILCPILRFPAGNLGEFNPYRGPGRCKSARKGSDLHFKSTAEGWFYYPCEKMEGWGERRNQTEVSWCLSQGNERLVWTDCTYRVGQLWVWAKRAAGHGTDSSFQP